MLRNVHIGPKTFTRGESPLFYPAAVLSVVMMVVVPFLPMILWTMGMEFKELVVLTLTIIWSHQILDVEVDW